MMFRDTVITAINDVFDHLGQEVTIRSRNGETKQVIAVIKQPENPYELGDSQIVEQTAEVSIKSSDATPEIGDFILVNDRRYKVFSPLTAFVFLVFCLLYTPCVAAIAAVKRELGKRYAFGVVFLQCAIA